MSERLERVPRSRKAKLLVPVLGACAVASGFGIRIVDPMVPVISSELAISIGSATLLVTVFSIAYALGQPILGPLGDVVGKVRMIVLCGGVTSLLLVACALAPSFVPLAVLRGVSGFVAGGIIPLAIAVISDRAGAGDRQVALGRFLIASILGQMLGAAASGAVSEMFGWRAVFLLTSALMAIATAIAFVTLPIEQARQEKFDMNSILSRQKAILSSARAVCLFSLVMLGAIAAYGIFPFVAAILAARFGTGSAEAGIVLAGFGLGGVLYALTVRQVIKRLGTTKMSWIGGLGSGVALTLFAFPLPWIWDVALFMVLGFSYFMLHNNFQTHASELAPESRGSAVSLFAFAVFAGQGIGPLAVGGAMSFLPVSVVAIALGLIIAGVGVFAPSLLSDAFRKK